MVKIALALQTHMKKSTILGNSVKFLQIKGWKKNLSISDT